MDLGRDLLGVYNYIINNAHAIKNDFEVLDPANECSRDNLLYYAVLRSLDINHLQTVLAERGLGSLGNIEGSVLHSIAQVLSHLEVELEQSNLSTPTLAGARQIVEERSTALFGRPRTERNTRVMVTLDPSYNQQPDIIEQLLTNGMDIARINCAHHDQELWQEMINTVRQAEEKLELEGRGLGRKCRIVMDLAGPKIRTGNLEKVIQPLRLVSSSGDNYVEGYLDCNAEYSECKPVADACDFVIAVNCKSDFSKLVEGNKLTYTDVNGKKRIMRVLEKCDSERIKVSCKSKVFIEEGTVFSSKRCKKIKVRSIPEQTIKLSCTAGDKLLLYRNKDKQGHLAEQQSVAGIACTRPDVLCHVKVGERVFIDDGKIICKVQAIHDKYLELEVISPVGVNVRIRENKGLNFPDSDILIPALTEEDIANLDFICEHATAINYSFVQTPEDIQDLHRELLNRNSEDIGIIAKVETKLAISNMTKILVTGLELAAFGVMVARGDLAVEVGFEMLPFVQEDILDLCDAAHIPAVLATQYLETLAKKGMPVRGEIIDAAMAQRGECIMLNKGAHVALAVKTLSNLIISQELRHSKKRQVYSEFTKQNGINLD